MNDLERFVLESNRIEGIHRELTHPQTVREIEVHGWFLRLKQVTIADLEAFVHVVQPGAQLRRNIGQNVRIGNHIAPLGGPDIESRLSNILFNMHTEGAYKTHLAYEDLHPFIDGNGRSGRVLWLRQMGGVSSIGFLHKFYYQTLDAQR